MGEPGKKPEGELQQKDLTGTPSAPQGDPALQKEVEEKQQRQQGDRDLGEDSHAQPDSQGMK